MFLFSLAAEGGLCGPVRFEQRLSPLSPLFISLFSYSFSKHCHSLHRETFEGGGTESFSETCCPKPCAFITHATRQSHAQQTPQRAREDELGGLHTHTHVYLLGFPLRDGEDSEIRRDLKRQSDSQSSQRSRLCLALPTCFCVRSRSHAQSVNRNLVFSPDIRSAEPNMLREFCLLQR